MERESRISAAEKYDSFFAKIFNEEEDKFYRVRFTTEEKL